MILSNIVRYEKNISSEDLINKKIETKDKWNQIHILSMESVLGANCSIHLIHILNRRIYIEETNQCINEFSFAYMFNPNLHTNKVFREQVKSCLSNTFGADTNKNINKILMKRNTRVLTLVVYYELGNLNPKRIFH